MAVVYQGHYLSFHNEEGWEYVSRHDCLGAAVLVPITKQNELVLVEQYRTPVKAKVLELPAGLVGDLNSEETWEQAAKRELTEETGYEAKELKLLYEGPTSAGLSDEKIRLYLATELKKVGKGGGDESEAIVVKRIPLAEIHNYLANYQQQGGLIDHKIYAGLAFLKGGL